MLGDKPRIVIFTSGGIVDNICVDCETEVTVIDSDEYMEDLEPIRAGNFTPDVVTGHGIDDIIAEVNSEIQTELDSIADQDRQREEENEQAQQEQQQADEDDVQSTRLLATIEALGLPHTHVCDIAREMDITPERVMELLHRATDTFRASQPRTLPLGQGFRDE